MNDRSTLSSGESVIEVSMSENRSQIFRDDYSRSIRIFDAKYKDTSTSLDDAIKKC
jgi:hypothetical protein